MCVVVWRGSHRMHPLPSHARKSLCPAVALSHGPRAEPLVLMLVRVLLVRAGGEPRPCAETSCSHRCTLLGESAASANRYIYIYRDPCHGSPEVQSATCLSSTCWCGIQDPIPTCSFMAAFSVPEGVSKYQVSAPVPG